MVGVCALLFTQASVYLYANRREAGQLLSESGVKEINLSEIKKERAKSPKTNLKNAQLPALPTIPLQITELRAGSDAGVNDEYVKIYNPNSQAVDLGGWSLKKATASGKEYSLVSQKSFQGNIAAGGFFIIAHRDYREQADLRYSNNSNALAYNKNSVALYNPIEELSDKVFYEKLAAGEIWQRK